MAILRDFRLEAYLSRWEFAARYNMTASDAESLTLTDLLNFGHVHDREAFHRIWLGYLPPAGTTELRTAIAATYETSTADDILCFAGAEEGIYVAMTALLGPEDHAIVVTPSYQSAETVALSICQATGIALNPERSWELDLNRLRDELRSNTKLISINFPNNPTGKVLERDIFDALVAFCRENGLWLLSDEVYRLMERDSARRLPQAVDCYERGLSLNALSKVYGLPGLRVGWVAAKDRHLLQRMERAKHYLSICNSAPSEALAVIAIKARHQIIARNRALIEANLKYVSEFFAESSELFEWTTPDGGMVGYPAYKGTDGVENFTRQALEEANVLFLPASIFHSELTPLPSNRFRIGYGRSHVVAGLSVMRDWLTRKSGTPGWKQPLIAD